MTWPDRIRPHGPLEQLTPRLWRVRGTIPALAMPRDMVVWRMDDGGLLIHSAVAMHEEGMADLEALGEPRVMIVPSGHHRLDAPAYRARYPDMIVVAPERALKPVTKVVPVNGTSEDVLPTHGVTVLAPDGLKATELVYEVDAGNGRALIFNDQLFHLEHEPGLRGAVLRYVTRNTGYFGIPPLARLVLLLDAAAYARWLRNQAGRTDLSIVTMSHGEPVHGQLANAHLHEAADRLG